MGEIADNLIEDGMDFYADHLNGHPNFPDNCPYCEEEDEDEPKTQQQIDEELGLQYEPGPSE